MIHALPGMGANERMFPPPWNKLPDFMTHNWKSCFDKNTLADVAETICKTGGISDGDSIVGASLGGMVASEITKIRKIKNLFLAGSATHKDEINVVIKMLQPLILVAPVDWMQFSANRIPNDLAQMFTDSNPTFIRAMCSAIFQWQGLTPSSTKVFRIHGTHDLVIPPPKKIDLLLKGGHLISITHATECVDFVDMQMEK